MRDWVSDHPQADRLRAGIEHGSAALRAGGSTGVRTIAGVLALALVGLTLTFVLALPLVSAVHSRLDADIVSATVLGGAQLLMVPTFAVWAAAYLSGGGFTLGEGTVYSPAEVVSGPLPAIPVLGALPDPETAAMPALGFVYLALGALAGWYLHRNLTRRYAGEPHWAAAVAGIAVSIAVAIGAMYVLSALTTGGFGPGRFAAEVGPVRGAFLGSLAWQLSVGMAAVAVVLHPATHRLVGAGLERVKGLLARSAAGE